MTGDLIGMIDIGYACLVGLVLVCVKGDSEGFLCEGGVDHGIIILDSEGVGSVFPCAQGYRVGGIGEGSDADGCSGCGRRGSFDGGGKPSKLSGLIV